VEAALDAGQIERVIEKNILPATANNRVLYAFFAPKFGIIRLKRKLLLAFIPFGEFRLYRGFANSKGYSPSIRKGEKDENGKRRS
jgi:hypothetical protein